MSAPAVAVSPDGKKFAASWMDKRAGKDDPNIYWAISEGPRFPMDAPVHDETKGAQNHPALAIDRSGTVWAAWEDDHSGTPEIWFRSSVNGSKGRLASDPSEGAPAFPALSANGGVVALTYEAAGESESRVIFRVVSDARGAR